MDAPEKNIHLSYAAAISAIALLVAACSPLEGVSSKAQSPEAQLTGAREVPPVSTQAFGHSTITIAADKTVSGMLFVNGMNATAAHIHQGAKDTNGPVIVPLTKTSDATFAVPADAKITDEQHASYMAGNLYINVHSTAYPGGEIRAQMNPK